MQFDCALLYDSERVCLLYGPLQGFWGEQVEPSRAEVLSLESQAEQQSRLARTCSEAPKPSEAFEAFGRVRSLRSLGNGANLVAKASRATSSLLALAVIRPIISALKQDHSSAISSRNLCVFESKLRVCFNADSCVTRSELQ